MKEELVITKMSLFEEKIVGDFYIMKVPGGWIFSRHFYLESGKPAFGVFVPEVEEVQK